MPFSGHGPISKTGCCAIAALCVAMLLVAVRAVAQNSAPVLAWHFDEADGDGAAEQMRHADGVVSGVYLRVPGVSGGALRLDGETSGVSVKAGTVPDLGAAFTVEAWIAIDAYPWNWAPIVDQRDEEEAGLFFGVDSFGHLGLQAAIGGAWQQLATGEQLPLKRWVHVAGSFSPASGMTLFVDGKQVAHSSTVGKLAAAGAQDLLIGRIRYPMVPAQWLHPKFPVWYSFDGILDEVSIFDKALSPEQMEAEFRRISAPKGDALPYPTLPSGPAGAGPFGATYATLEYDPLWDAPRRVGRDSDVVVRFDDSPVRLVAWQGTNYIPAWVTENGKWYTDEFVETWSLPNCPGGEDCEPMSDKQNRYAHVRILENTAARTVIHVRYGLCEVENYACANPDPLTGWTDLADDYYTVYPDEVAARKTVAWSSALKRIPEFQETIIINQPGTRPEDNIETDALTLLNMKGEAHTYSWVHPPSALAEPGGANIQVVNLKSAWRPFQIVMPDRAMLSTYTGERSRSMFEWWNHWPVAQVKSSGISAVAPDRASHSSLSHIEGQPYGRTADSVTKVMLDGLSNQPAGSLVALARSWASAPAMKVAGSGFEGGFEGGFENKGYDPGQRAFVLKKASEGAESLRLTLDASEGSPLVNPAFVVENWGEAAPVVTLNGKLVEWGKDARFGLVGTLGGSTLVVWLRVEAVAEATIEIEAAR